MKIFVAFELKWIVLSIKWTAIEVRWIELNILKNNMVIIWYYSIVVRKIITDNKWDINKYENPKFYTIHKLDDGSLIWFGEFYLII